MIRSETLGKVSVIAVSSIFSSERLKDLGNSLPHKDHKRFDSCKLVRYQEHFGEKDLYKCKAAIMIIYYGQILF